MKRTNLIALTIVAFATLTVPASAQDLGTAASFAVLGGQMVSNTGPTIVNGDLGVWPGTAISGFPPGIVNGAIHSADAVAMQAQSDVTTAYNTLAGLPPDATLPGAPAELGGLTLLAGVYTVSSSAQLTGTLTLDAEGNPNALFVFNIPSALTTAPNSAARVINGGSGCNVWWRIGSSATLDVDTAFVGNILALTSITLNTRANIVPGRALARNGSVTMDTNLITRTTCTGPGGGGPPDGGGGDEDATTISVRKTATVSCTERPSGAIQCTVRGTICVRNTGNFPTFGLMIRDTIQVRIGNYPWKDLASISVDVSQMPFLLPGEEFCYPYEIAFTPVSPKSYQYCRQPEIRYRNVGCAKIANPTSAAGPRAVCAAVLLLLPAGSLPDSACPPRPPKPARACPRSYWIRSESARRK